MNADLARRGLPRDRVIAAILRILSTCFLRPGSQVYAAENGSFGIATLRKSHVGVRGELIRLDFPGKRLFTGSGDKLPLKLLDSATFGSGVVHSTYAKA